MMTANDYAKYLAEQVAKNRDEAKEEERLVIAKAMLSTGADVSYVVTVTGLSKEQVKSLKAES